MKRSKFALAAFLIAATAGLALGQTSTSVKGNYRIALVAPNEGESIAPDQVRVVLTPNLGAMGDSKTQVDVFLDDQQKGVIKANETEFRVEGVKPGPHKLVLIARNPVSDAVFDRREINFVATGDSKSTGVASVSENAVGAHVPAAVSSTDKQHSYTATDATQSAQNSTSVEDRSANKPSSSASTYSSSTSSSTATYAPPPAPAPSTYSPPASSSSSNMHMTMARSDENARLPKTASSDALLALAGAALIAAGVVLRRNG